MGAPRNDDDAPPLLAAEDVCVSLTGRVRVDRVGFRAEAGSVLAVLGPNGAGKSSLLAALAGVLPHTGTVRVRGQEARTLEARARSMAWVPDEVVLPDEMSLGLALGLDARNPFVETLGLTALVPARASEVSRGEAKRAQLAAALGSRREVLLLDEPFGALDPRQLRELLPVFREATRERAVVVTVHQMRTAELIADRILLLVGGRPIAHGTLDELRARVEMPGASLDRVFLALLDREAPRAA